LNILPRLPALAASLRQALATLALALLLAAAGGDGARAATERILSFTAEITVAPDGALHVVEEIEVEAAGRQIQRGIYRDFPLYGRTALGLNFSPGFEVERVARDGMAEPYFLVDQPGGVRIYIGQEDRLLPHGRYRYTIAYRTDRQLLHLEGEDELYWNVTGNDWSFPIDAAMAIIRLPLGTVPTGIVGFTGPPSSQARNFRILDSGPGEVRLATTAPLAPGEGFTVAVGWPEGAVRRPGSGERLAHLVNDNRGTLAGIVLLMVLVAVFLAIHRRVGRDPSPGLVIPLFEPPAGLSPVAAGFVWNRGFSPAMGAPRALTIILTDLAAKGVITLEEGEKGGFVVERTGDVPANLPAEEAAVLAALFPGTEPAPVPFGRKYEPRVGAALRALRDRFGKVVERRWFRKNRRPWMIGAALAAVTAAAALILDARGAGEAAVLVFMLLFAAAFATPVLLLIVTAVRTWRTGGLRSIAGGILILVVAVVFLAPVGALLFFLSELVAPPAIVIAILAVLISILFWFRLETVTEEGSHILTELEGYRLYLSLAEGDRLNQAGRGQEITEALYEAHLPYAMALGVEQQWTARFAASLERSSSDPAASRSAYRPRWYRNRGADWQGPATLTGRLSRDLGRATASAARSPSTGGSSSGRSGGSSGGGRGGGGGGGW